MGGDLRVRSGVAENQTRQCFGVVLPYHSHISANIITYDIIYKCSAYISSRPHNWGFQQGFRIGTSSNSRRLSGKLSNYIREGSPEPSSKKFINEKEKNT